MNVIQFPKQDVRLAFANEVMRLNWKTKALEEAKRRAHERKKQ